MYNIQKVTLSWLESIYSKFNRLEKPTPLKKASQLTIVSEQKPRRESEEIGLFLDTDLEKDPKSFLQHSVLLSSSGPVGRWDPAAPTIWALWQWDASFVAAHLSTTLVLHVGSPDAFMSPCNVSDVAIWRNSYCREQLSLNIMDVTRPPLMGG